MSNSLNGQMSNETKQTTPADSGTTGGNTSAERPWFNDVSIKELISVEEVQEAFRRYVNFPDGTFIVKKAKKAYGGTKEIPDKTQKIEVLSGKTLEDAFACELTLLNTEIDPIAAINKKYRLIDYKFALTAIMREGEKEKKFGGYASSGLRLIVTKLEEVK